MNDEADELKDRAKQMGYAGVHVEEIVQGVQRTLNSISPFLYSLGICAEKGKIKFEQNYQERKKGIDSALSDLRRFLLREFSDIEVFCYGEIKGIEASEQQK